MWKWLIVLIGIGAWYWAISKPDSRPDAEAFNNLGEPIVMVLTVDECPACQWMTKELKARRVPFEERRVSAGDDDSDDMKLWRRMKARGFPLLLAGNASSDGGGSRMRLVSVLGEVFGDQYLTRAENRYFKNHFYPDGSPKIVMYGADWCGYCRKLRNEFYDNGVDFVEIDVEKSGEKTAMSRTMEISGYPATWVGYTRVNGTNYRAVKKVLNP